MPLVENWQSKAFNSIQFQWINGAQINVLGVHHHLASRESHKSMFHHWGLVDQA